MRILKDFSNYIIEAGASITEALYRLNANKVRTIFVVSEKGEVLGSLTDGDFRRWVLKQDQINLQASVTDMISQDFCKIYDYEKIDNVTELFQNGVNVIPILSKSKRIVSIITAEVAGFMIGNREISEKTPTFIIAEIGNNHNGNFELAKKLVNLAFDSGADCAKFQMRNMSNLYKFSNEKNNSEDLGVEYTMDLLAKYQLTNEQLIALFDHCRTLGMEPLCTPWDLDSLRILENYGMSAYKVASADLTNVELLEALASTRKPLICSTGMATEKEIIYAHNFLNENAANYVFLHCNSTYPTPLKDVNLKYIEKLKKITGRVVGYSGHERGTVIPVAAVSLGAKIIEKHFTLDKTMEGNDHKVSLLPHEFKSMVAEIRTVEEALGTADPRELTQGEMMNRENLAKSLVAARPIKKGEKISRDAVVVTAPGQGLQPMYIEQLIGRLAQRDVEKGDYFYNSDLTNRLALPRNYHFNRPFGLPVRYHDFESISKQSNLDFVEFHLSYHDLKLDPEDFILNPKNLKFAVHSPELFENDHILNLASLDESYRQTSLQNLVRVIEATRKLKSIFQVDDERPVIIVNAGGFSHSGFQEPEMVSESYRLIAETLSRIDSSGVEIIIQTMPPFPWHFGGQAYHNAFVSADEIIEFYNSYKYRICLDISHSRMACTFNGWDFNSFIKKVAPITAHLHVVDALGVDGEGIEVGQGDVDFDALTDILDEFAPNVPFIPEIWQGHKNNGEGFWNALQYLEQYFDRIKYQNFLVDRESIANTINYSLQGMGYSKSTISTIIH